MGRIIPITFGHQTDQGRYGYETGPWHLNAYVQQVKESRKRFPIYAAAGLATLDEIADGADCRGAIAFDGTTGYIMSGSAIMKITWDGTNFTRKLIGGITATGQAIMARNQAATPQIIIVVDGQKYKLIDDKLSPIASANLPTPVSCTFLNQRILYAIEDGRTFYSNVNEGQTVNASSVFTAEGSADTLVRGVAHMQEYWAFGSSTIEIWRNTGDASSPFRRNTGAVIPKGLASRFSVAQLDANIFWVGDDLSVYMAAGYSPQKISTQHVEEDIRTTADKSSILGFSYYSRGNAFYTLQSPAWSWQYNRTTGAWIPRQSQGHDRWRAQGHLKLSEDNLVGDYASAKLYKLDEDVHTEDGEDLPVILRSPPIGNYPDRYIMDRLFLDFMPGVGLNTSAQHAKDPQVGLRWSDDMGRTWSTQKFRKLGALGAYGTRVIFDALGTTGEAGRILEVELSAPVKRVLVNAAFEGEKVQT